MFPAPSLALPSPGAGSSQSADAKAVPNKWQLLIDWNAAFFTKKEIAAYLQGTFQQGVNKQQLGTKIVTIWRQIEACLNSLPPTLGKLELLKELAGLARDTLREFEIRGYPKDKFYEVTSLPMRVVTEARDAMKEFISTHGSQLTADSPDSFSFI